MSRHAASGCFERALIASCAPPSAAVGRPPPGCAGIGAIADASGDLRVTGLEQGVGIGPVAHHRRLAILEREPHLLFLPREHGVGGDALHMDAIAHPGERAHGRVVIDDDGAAIVEDAPTEAAENLEKDGHQSFIARTLPRNPGADARCPSRSAPWTCSSSKVRGGRSRPGGCRD